MPEPEVPEIVITDDRPVPPVVPPVVPEPEVPEIVITDDRPVPPVVPPVVPEPEVPEIVITDDRPVPPVVPEPEVPEIVIVDDRPPPPPPEPPVIIDVPPLEPVVPPPEPPEPPIVDPEPPVLPPLPPVVPPVTPPPEPPVTPPPPPVPPTPPQLPTREMINPGFIQPRAFYNTTNDAQSKFFWGGHGPQFGTNQFDARAYNQAAAPSTPWGLGQVAAPLSPAEVQAAIEGRYVPRAGTPAATRAEAYSAPTTQPYQYGQVQVGGPVAPAATTTTPTGKTKDSYTADQRSQISATLGSNWQRDLDNAALNGDYATIVRIQNTIDAILNPPQVMY